MPDPHLRLDELTVTTEPTDDGPVVVLTDGTTRVVLLLPPGATLPDVQGWMRALSGQLTSAIARGPR